MIRVPDGEITGAVYAFLRMAAVENRPCPTNRQIADVLGYQSSFTVSNAIHGMAMRGAFWVKRFGMNRQIVFADGAETLSPNEGIEDIIAKAGVIFDVKVSAILGPERHVRIIRARQAAMTVACEAGYGRAMVGRVLARDHSTVCHAIAVSAEYERRDPKFAARLAELRYSSGLTERAKLAA